MTHELDWILDLHFDELLNSVNVLERALRQEREAVLEKYRDEIEALREDGEIETDFGVEVRATDRHYEIATQIERYCEEIPRLVMNSMLVSTWALFERKMMGLATERIVNKARLSDDGFRAAGKIREMKQVEEYFTKEGITLPPGWDFVNLIREIRNQIVHDGGIRHELDDVTDPVELTRHKRSLKIGKFVEEQNELGNYGVQYRCDAILTLSPDFCREIVEFLRNYVKEISLIACVPFNDADLIRRMEASEKRSGKA